MYLEVPFAGDPNNDEALVAVVRANPQARIELSSDGKIIASPLTGSAVASKELEAAIQLHAWARVAGGKAYGASAGFRLPDTSVLGPDAAWISPERLPSLRFEDTDATFWHVCPDVVIEVMSQWDTWPRLMRKISLFVKNGATYAVALDCERRQAYELGNVPPGLQLDFDAIYDA
jgi:Uma2 family endonuclease